MQLHLTRDAVLALNLPGPAALMRLQSLAAVVAVLAALPQQRTQGCAPGGCAGRGRAANSMRWRWHWRRIFRCSRYPSDKLLQHAAHRCGGAGQPWRSRPLANDRGAGSPGRQIARYFWRNCALSMTSFAEPSNTI
ncbi:MAG: hypothetical protein KA316_08840, partial [Rhodoferax sp.]|nr:hypothetical protein [Rhodoferax sp.]